MQAYRERLRDERIGAAEREDYIRYLEADRVELRERLRDDRRRREERCATGAATAIPMSRPTSSSPSAPICRRGR